MYDTIYGDAPQDLGFVHMAPSEMMFWLYCPIQVPNGPIVLPDNLEQFEPLLERVYEREIGIFKKYVYLTAKTLWVSGDYIGNRPGWHSDGFGTHDINYVWCDRAPTEFYRDRFTLPKECATAMEIMTERAERAEVITYPDKHLLRLTPSVIHRCPVNFDPGMRTFIKVSISTERYNLEGNSINHGLGEQWPLLPREKFRNHPVRADYVEA